MDFIYKGKKFILKSYDESDLIYQRIKGDGTFYEIDLLEYIQFVCMGRKNQIAIDVGANIGNHSIFLQNFVCDKVISIEPNYKILDILKENLSVNCNRYSLIPKAVGEESLKGKLTLPSEGKNNIGMMKVDKQISNGDVEIEPLSSLVKIFDAEVALIKIDVEGMEADVLKGSIDVILKYKPELFVEAGNDEAFKRVNDILNPLGYASVSCWASTPVYHFTYGSRFMNRFKSLAFKLFKKISNKFP